MTGPELKARRKELGLTMQDIADRVGLVHRQQVYEWERGKVRPGRKHLRKLAMVLQVSITDLIGVTMFRQQSPISLEADSASQRSIRRMGRPIRTVPVAHAKPAAPTRHQIRRWMLSHIEEHRDPKTGEVNSTELVEAWDRTCSDGGATLDPDHIAWDVAAALE